MIEIQKDDDGSVDQVVAKNCMVHLEKMGDREWWMAIYGNDGSEVHVDFTECRITSYPPDTQRSLTLRGAVAGSMSEPCPADNHTYYGMFLSYQFCPHCGERVTLINAP